MQTVAPFTMGQSHLPLISLVRALVATVRHVGIAGGLVRWLRDSERLGRRRRLVVEFQGFLLPLNSSQGPSISTPWNV